MRRCGRLWVLVGEAAGVGGVVLGKDRAVGVQGALRGHAILHALGQPLLHHLRRAAKPGQGPNGRWVQAYQPRPAQGCKVGEGGAPGGAGTAERVRLVVPCSRACM